MEFELGLLMILGALSFLVLGWAIVSFRKEMILAYSRAEDQLAKSSDDLEKKLSEIDERLRQELALTLTEATLSRGEAALTRGEAALTRVEYDKFVDTMSALVLVIPALLAASKKIENFEQFFEDSLDDVEGVIEMLDRLMKRQVVSDDPDVKDFYRVMSITHDTLLGYRNNGQGKEEEKED